MIASIKKKEMESIINQLKRARLISEKIIIGYECLLPLMTKDDEFNGMHLIHHSLPFPDEYKDLYYITYVDIASILKELTDKKGMKSIELEWTPTTIGFIVNGDTYPIATQYQEVPELSNESFQEKLNKRDWFIIPFDRLRDIKNSKVYQTQHGGVRISKNLIPCIGVTKMIADPNFTIEYALEVQDDDWIIILHVKYPIFEALHYYSYIPFQEELKNDQ